MPGSARGSRAPHLRPTLRPRSARPWLIVLPLAACSHPTLPPGYEAIDLGSSAGTVLEQRPAARPDGQNRLYDPTGPAAFRIVDGEVRGVRLLVRPPADKPILERTVERLADRAVEGRPYTFRVGDQELSLFSSAAGVQFVLGEDPGPIEGPLLKPVAPPPPDRGPSLVLARTSRPSAPSRLPIGERVNGIGYWLLPLPGAAGGPVALRLVLALGAHDETLPGQGSTALLAEHVRSAVLATAEARAVRLETTPLRTATVFSLRGASADVEAVALALAGQLARVAGRPPSGADLERAHTASLRHHFDDALDRRTLIDEGLAALFSTSAVPAPADRTRPAPEAKEVQSRAAALAGAPAFVIAAGNLDRRFGRELARALGPRPVLPRFSGAPSGLPHRHPRHVAAPAVAIDGLWAPAADLDEAAMNLLAAGLLDRRARRQLAAAGVADGPRAAAWGGLAGATYLVVAGVAASDALDALDAATGAAVTGLGQPPSGEAFEALRHGVLAEWDVRLAAPEPAVEAMLDLALAGLEVSEAGPLFERIGATTELAFHAHVARLCQPERSFSVRWGPSP